MNNNNIIERKGQSSRTRKAYNIAAECPKDYYYNLKTKSNLPESLSQNYEHLQ